MTSGDPGGSSGAHGYIEIEIEIYHILPRIPYDSINLIGDSLFFLKSEGGRRNYHPKSKMFPQIPLLSELVRIRICSRGCAWRLMAVKLVISGLTDSVGCPVLTHEISCGGRWAGGRVRPVTCHDSTTPHLTPHLLPLPCLLNIHIPSSLPTQQSSQYNPLLERKCWLFGQRRVRDVDLLPVFRKLDCVISHLLCTAGSRGINREKSTNIQTENYLSSVDLIRTDVLIVLNNAN